MRTCLCVGVLVLAAAVVPSQAGGKKEEFDRAKLAGKWTYVSGVKNGAKVAADTLAKQKIEIDKEKFTLTGDDLFIMSYELDTKTTPIGIAFTITKSPFGAGMKASGIIELKGDEMKLCYNPEGGKAPTKFESPADSKLHYFVLKKAK